VKILELLKKLYKYFTNKNKTHGVSSGEELRLVLRCTVISMWSR